MNKSKIEWCDSTWNPVTGCMHGCEYCYARNQTRRFSGHDGFIRDYGSNGLHEIDVAAERKTKSGKFIKAPYPFGFEPTFHRYRLNEPVNVKQPQNIFVGSMADLFGDWVPDEWIKAVFEACASAPQHKYLFLTKNPDRYYQLGEGDENIIPDDGICGWFGASATTEEQAQAAYENLNCTWMSLEPLHGEFSEEFFTHTVMVGDGVVDEIRRWQWIVIGAETGSHKRKVVPKREWIENIIEQCHAVGTPVLMKNSLAAIWKEPLIQEFPWEC